MAPPSRSRRATRKAARPHLRQEQSSTQQSDSAASIPETKRDKLQIRNSLLVSKARVSALNDKSRISKENKRTKPRRPNRSLQSTRDLSDALASALPELDEPSTKTSNARDRDDGSKRDKSRDYTRRKPNPATTSLKSRRGIQARKERIANLEKDRFQRNLGIMNTSGGESSSTGKGDAANSNANSRATWWTALRQQIAQSVSNKDR